MKSLLFVWISLFALWPLAGHTEELKCQKGDQMMLTDYKHAISLIQGGERLSEDQENEVIRALEVAVKNQCQQAALVLAEIRINQAAALPKGAARQTIDEFDDKIHALLLEARKIGEGQFQLGSFYLMSGSKYYAPQKGVRILEAAANIGDGKSIELLSNIHQNGIDGIKANRAKADCWKAKLR
jgi:TPR repeat protein